MKIFNCFTYVIILCTTLLLVVYGNNEKIQEKLSNRAENKINDGINSFSTSLTKKNPQITSFMKSKHKTSTIDDDDEEETRKDETADEM